VSEFINELRKSFVDQEYRDSYAESFMNSCVAAQIKILREEREFTQQELAEKIGTKQAGISRLENVNYSAWKVETLRKVARALRVRLRISFEEFGTLPDEIGAFDRDGLFRRAFEQDPVFNPSIAAQAPAEARAGAALQSPNAGTSQLDNTLGTVANRVGPGATVISVQVLSKGNAA
jgi:transcriptional regulator with XRE-family HTH domain